MVIFTLGITWVDDYTSAPQGEAILSLPVSRAARRAYLRAHPGVADSFRAIRGGYRMTGYESQIAACRASGQAEARGGAAGPSLRRRRRARPRAVGLRGVKGGNVMTEVMTTQHDWTFVGQRLDRKGKATFAWLDDADEVRWYGKLLAPSAVVGSVYRIHLTEEGAVLIKGAQAPRFLRMSDDARLPAWRAEHAYTRARIEAERARKRAAEEHRGDLGRMTLSEAAAWYRSRALPDQRAGALAVLIQYIQYGR